MDADGLSALSRSGGDADQWDDAGSGNRLLAETLQSDGSAMVAGAQLGVPFPYCSVTDYSPSGLAVVGLPSVVRRGGFALCDIITHYLHASGGDSDTWQTVMVRADWDATARQIDSFTTGTEGFQWNNSMVSGGRVSAVFRDSGGVYWSSGFVATSLASAAQPLSYWFSFNLSTGAAVARIYEDGNATPLGTVTRASGSVPSPYTADWITGQAFDEMWLYTGALSTSEIQDEQDGVTDTAAHKVIGLSSGCYDSVDATILPIESGAGSNVTAEAD